MPSRKERSEPPWLVILEDIRSQNRATLEAVEASRVSHDGKLDRFAEETRSRFTVVETAIQSTNRTVAALDRKFELRFEQSDEQNRLRFAALEAALQRIDQESRSRDASLELAVRDVKVAVQQNSVDIRDLTGKVEALSRLEERVSALERRGA